MLVVTGVLSFRVCLVARRTGCDDCADPSVGKVVAGGTGLGSRVRTIDGSFGHVEVELNGSVILMFDAQPSWAPIPAHLRGYIQDAHGFDRATTAGARKSRGVLLTAPFRSACDRPQLHENGRDDAGGANQSDRGAMARSPARSIVEPC